jgi:2,4'-dihydroxyacetophenone dioxygenase
MSGLDVLREYLPARVSGTAHLPWIPSTTPGKSSKPLRFFSDDRGFVELLRMEPGVVMPLHHHTGEIHAYNLSGSRQLCTGEIVRPGDYAYEPPGNIDSWRIVGDEPMIALVVVMGAVEFLGAGGEVQFRASAQSQLREYHDYCERHGLTVVDLVD